MTTDELDEVIFAITERKSQEAADYLLGYFAWFDDVADKALESIEKLQ